MEPLEDVFPIENGDIPANYVSVPEGRLLILQSISMVVSGSPKRW